MPQTDDEAGPAKHDLVLAGGTVIDPANGRNGRADVAIAGGRISGVSAELGRLQGRKTIDVSGYLVTPGLVDIHTHVAVTNRKSSFPIEPTVNTVSSGVTTIVDAGTVGADGFELFKSQVVDTAPLRVLSFLNIVRAGMDGPHEDDESEMEPELAAEVALANPETVVGIKTAHYWVMKDFDARHEPWTAVNAALRAGELCGLPVMVDSYPWIPGRSYPELILERMRPGDIHTHVFAKQFPLLDRFRGVYDYMFEAQARGVVFDLGHGEGSFWFRNAVPAVSQGFLPDSISTDLHRKNVNGPVVDLLSTMNKILNIGVPLERVIRMVTQRPADEIGRPDLGRLSVGLDADIAVLALEVGSYSFVDCGGYRLSANEQLECRMTFRSGEVIYNPRGLGLDSWRVDAARTAIE